MPFAEKTGTVFSMKWIELAVYTTDEGIEAVCNALASVGIDQVSIEESSQQVAAFLEQTAKYWDYADADALAAKDGPCVKAYLSQLEETEPLLAAARAAVESLKENKGGLDLGSLAIRETLVDDEDWANSWKAYYKPIEIGSRLIVCPTWEETEAGERIVLKMDPGMVFGTGTHETTRMCLEALEERVKGNETVLDIGCGSGILAIAALLLGAKDAVLADIDPVARSVVEENFDVNGVDRSRGKVFIGDVLQEEKLRKSLDGAYDIVIANIVADVIIALSPYIQRYLKADGTFLCSGIINEREQDVRAALEKNGFVVEKRMNKENWVAMACKRKEQA